MSVGGSAWRMVRHGADYSRKGYGSSYDPRIQQQQGTQMKRKPHPPHPVHSGDGDMPWLDPGKLPKPTPKTGGMEHVIEQITALLRSLPSQHDRHRCVGMVLSRMVESEHIKLNPIFQFCIQEVNRYNYIDR